jgi:hypothetical protein
MARDFSALNRHGRRDYEFVQGDSYKLVQQRYGSEMKNGVCMGIVLNWVKEKLTTSNGALRPTGTLLNSAERRFSTPPAGSSMPKWIGKQPAPKQDIGARNEATTLMGGMTHKYYQDKGADRNSAARKLGLLAGKYQPAPKAHPSNDGTYKPEHITDEAIAKTAEELPKGNAIVIELQQDGAGSGHAIAFYNSRGGTLYFFDPNAGVYEILRPFGEHLQQFVQAWLEVYRNETPTPVNWKTNYPDDWYGVYNRAGDGEGG